MGKLYYEIGLTDEDSESFVHADNSALEKLSYTLKRQEPRIEKATLVWEFLDTPVVRGVIDAWEKTIRIPHLLMNNVRSNPTSMHTDYTDTKLEWNYINLVPLQDFQSYHLTISDAELIETNDHAQFGVLYMDYNQSMDNDSYDWQASWRYALDHDTIKHLREGPPTMKAVPAFHANFSLMKSRLVNTEMSQRNKMFLERKRNDLDAYGYVATDPRCKIGSYRLGNLVTDPTDANAALAKFKYPCRHSIVSEEVRNTRDKKSG
jgi:hypothetical protein